MFEMPFTKREIKEAMRKRNEPLYVFEYDATNRSWECQLASPDTQKFEIVADGWTLMGELIKVPLVKVALPESLITALMQRLIRASRGDIYKIE